MAFDHEKANIKSMSLLKGWLGEKIASLIIGIRLNKRCYPRFHNIITSSPTGIAQIDHVIVSRFGIFVIETKNYSGWIFGGKKQSKWTQSIYGKNFNFQNPLHQNYWHIKCLSQSMALPESKFVSIVFFNGTCTFRTEMPSNVINHGLVPYIKSFQETIVSEEEVSLALTYLTNLRNNPALTRRAHLKSLKSRYSSTTICPKCGSSLIVRTVKNGERAGISFLGCYSYPKCKYTKDL